MAAQVGIRVLTPMNPLTNGGVDFAPAIVTEIVDTSGPNGNPIVNIQSFGNTALNVLGFITDVELTIYEDDARTLGIGNGAWPLDYP
jgi:hypothetical protein